MASTYAVSALILRQIKKANFFQPGVTHLECPSLVN